MLKIKKSFSLHLPHLQLTSTQPMELSAVLDDGDELSQAMKADPDDHDDNWVLTDRPDESELDAFWTTVEDDVRKDPKWFTFDD